MPEILLDLNLFYGLIAIAGLSIFTVIVMIMTISRSFPDALVYWKASRSGQPIATVHFRGRVSKKYVAQVDKIQKDMGTPYWRVPQVGLKFKPTADDIEIIGGGIREVHYYTNMTEAMAISTVKAYDEVKHWFSDHKMPIDNIQDIAFYVAQDYVKHGDKQRAINNAKIESKELKGKLIEYLAVLDYNRKELEKMKLTDGIFSFQTAMHALDSVLLTTSTHMEHLESVVKAAAKREMEDQIKKYQNFMFMAIVAFILVIAGVVLLKALGKI